MSRRRVVVTGIGMLSPLGIDVAQSWSGILAGKSGISSIEHFDVEAFAMILSNTCLPKMHDVWTYLFSMV